jgi:hypothetical protein
VTPIFIRRPQILAFWIALDWNPAGARSNLEDSIERLLAEPGTVGSRVMTLKSILANSHRFAHASMALDAYRSRISATPGRPACLRESRVLGSPRNANLLYSGNRGLTIPGSVIKRTLRLAERQAVEAS